MMPRMRSLFVAALVLSVGGGACSDGFGTPRGGPRLTVELKDADKVTGSRLNPLPLTVDTPQPFRIVVRALDQNGNIDTSYSGFVRISAKPGAIERLAGNETEGRNLKLTNGESPETEVKITNGYGPTYILADDLGYWPADPLGTPPPSCSNGIDDDGDGKIDFPADEGCAFANDDSEVGGSYAQGASPPIYYRLPRIADVRGLRCDATGTTCFGNGTTVYPKEQILLDTGYHDKPDGTQAFDFDMVVTRISSDGFYVTDTKDTRGGFNNIFSFNFSAPPRMRVCDRLKTFGGTANEFFGLTQISYPTWTLEEWDPQKRPCLVPEPHPLTPDEVNPTSLLPLSAGLVRALSLPGQVEVKVTPKFGPGSMPCKDKSGKDHPLRECIDVASTPCKDETGKALTLAECVDRGLLEPTFTLSSDAGTNCDLNDDGRLDLTKNAPEERCLRVCNADPECTEYSNFVARSTFRLTIKDVTSGTAAAVQADATASAEFKPLEMKGKPIKAFTGTLHYFSGGSQFTIEARCKDDIVTDMNQTPLPSDKACVFPRTVVDENPQ